MATEDRGQAALARTAEGGCPYATMPSLTKLQIC